MSTQQEKEMTVWGFSKAFNRNWISAILASAGIIIGVLASKWQIAESEKNQCYKESVTQEQRHSKEKEEILNRQLEQNYKIGELSARVEILSKLVK